MIDRFDLSALHTFKDLRNLHVFPFEFSAIVLLAFHCKLPFHSCHFCFFGFFDLVIFVVVVVLIFTVIVIVAVVVDIIIIAVNDIIGLDWCSDLLCRSRSIGSEWITF